MVLKSFLLCTLCAFVLTNCQENPTVTEDLLQAQQELTIGHEFAEISLVENRDRLSENLATIEKGVLDSFLVAYTQIKNIGIETRELMNEFGSSECEDRVRARWELQVTRYGQRLSQCLGVTHGYLNTFTNTLNSFQHESRFYNEQIPNTSVNVLSRLDIFTGRDSLRDYINDEFRDILMLGDKWSIEAENYVDWISSESDEMIRQFTTCFRSLPNWFQNESNQDLRAIQECDEN